MDWKRIQANKNQQLTVAATLKNLSKIFILVLTTVFMSCSSSVDKTKDKEVKQPISDTILNGAVSSKQQDLRERCARGQAEPIVKKNVFPKTTFVFQPDSLSGIETIDFENGDKLIIENTGCEYYVLKFRFETSRFKNDTMDISRWYKNLASLLYGVANGLEAPISIEKGTKALVNYIDIDSKQNQGRLRLKEEIDFGGTDIRTFATVDRIQKISANKFAVEISFITGPL